MQQERCRNEEKGVARLSHGDSGGLRVTRFDPFDTARAIELAIYYWSRPKHPCDGPACRASTVLLYNSSARGKSPDVAGGGKGHRSAAGWRVYGFDFFLRPSSLPSRTRFLSLTGALA